tara:strand:- start:3294 stop:4745 length:1452 start_codon:yes stop_codon:yes gene_type:complete
MDWKGAALVLQQLGELRKPSQLEVAEKQYELEAKETEAKRRHELALASLEGIQSNIENLDKLLVEKVKAGNDIAIGLSSIGKKENISGNAASLNEQLYSQEFADYEGARKKLNTQYNDKYDQLNEQIQINNAAGLGKQFVETNYELGGENYFDRAQIKIDDYGNISYDSNFNVIPATTLRNNLSYEEAKYAIQLAANENFQDDIQKQSFITGAMASLKQPQMKKATDALEKEFKKDIDSASISKFPKDSPEFKQKAADEVEEFQNKNIGLQKDIYTLSFEGSEINNIIQGIGLTTKYEPLGKKRLALTADIKKTNIRPDAIKYNLSHNYFVLQPEFKNDGTGIESKKYNLTQDTYNKLIYLSQSDDTDTYQNAQSALQLFHIAMFKYRDFLQRTPDGYPVFYIDKKDGTKKDSVEEFRKSGTDFYSPEGLELISYQINQMLNYYKDDIEENFSKKIKNYKDSSPYPINRAAQKFIGMFSNEGD